MYALGTLLVVVAALQPHEVPTAVFVDRAGFPELVVHSAVNGAVVGGIVASLWVPGDDTAATMGPLVGLGAGVLLPMWLTRGAPVHAADAAFYNLAQRWGLANGWLLPLAFNSTTRWHEALSIAGMTAGGVGLAVFLNPELRLTPGQVSALGTAHTFSTSGVALLLTMFDVVFDSGTSFAVPVLLASNAAVAATYVLRDHFEVDRRRMIWTDIGGYLGSGVGLGIGILAVGRDDWRGQTQALAGAVFAGMAGGMVSGYWLSGRDGYKSSADAVSFAPQPQLVPTLDRDGRAAWAFGIELTRGQW